MGYTKNQNDRFINPYNFVPVSKKADRSVSVADREAKAGAGDSTDDLHTGYIDCLLTTYTPLSIPDVANAVEMESSKGGHLKYPFLRMEVDGEKKAVIPGSSLRGVIRSVYETATNSCMVTMDPDEHITNRVSASKDVKPCLLIKENNNWVLYEARRVPLVGKGEDKEYTDIYAKLKVKVNKEENGEKYIRVDDVKNNKVKKYNGDKVYITSKGPGHKKNGGFPVWKNSVDSIIAEQEEGYTPGYLFLGEYIRGKHAESVFIKGQKIDLKEDALKNAMRGLKDTLEIYRNESINRNLNSTHYGYRGFERAEKKGVIPLWYQMESDSIYLYLAAVGRKAYKNSMEEISNGHNPCSDRKKLCPACAVFGMVGKNEGKGIGSRVRISDAICVNEVPYPGKDHSATLKELGSPRVGYLPFYCSEGNSKTGYDSKGAQIRGRKFYWHNPAAANNSNEYSGDKIERNKRNGTFELVNTGSKFKFRVYFDDLDTKEINTLMFLLCLGGNESNLMYKIGHGKPLGLGSVKISLEGAVERTFDFEKGFGTEEYDIKNYLGKCVLSQDGFETDIDNKAWEDLSIIHTFKQDNVKVRYPYIVPSNGAFVKNENDIASHKWFTEYKKDNSNKLPGIKEAKNKPLYSMIYTNDNRNNSRNNSRNNNRNGKPSGKKK